MRGLFLASHDNESSPPKNLPFQIHASRSARCGIGCGGRERPASTDSITKKLWEYIHEYGLQDTLDKRLIHADEALLAVFDGKEVVTMFEMTKL